MKKSKNNKEVFERYLSNTHSVEDFRRIQSYFSTQDEGELFDLVENKIAEDYHEDEVAKVAHIISKTDEVIDKLIVHEVQIRTVMRNPTARNTNVLSFAVAAVLLCIVSFSLYFMRTKSDTQIETRNLAEDASPGDNKATLILGDGTVLSLDSMDLGVISETKGLLVSKDDDGIITYKSKPILKDSEINFSTLKTPRGGQYRVILEDGTKVWLNAASSIRYPNRFATHERKIELVGEAYFEVSKNRDKPFIVVSEGHQVKVLGTEFNINTYDYQGNTQTTLIEGSVEIAHRNNKLKLAPGQQALVKNEKITLVDKIDTKQATAWKRGEFYFDGANMEEIMHQVQKWYNVDVEYRGTIDHAFVLKINRNVNLSEILNILEMTDLVHFKFEENKIIVTP